MRIHQSHLIFIYGSASSLLGVLVMLAWHANLSFLIQTKSTFAPMIYNSALGFLFSGLGLIFGIYPKLGLRKIFGALVTVLGGLTLIEYLFDVNLGIDEVIVQSYVNIKASHPGRMAPNTALAFFIFGISLLCWSKEKSYKNNFCTGILGSMVHALAIVALFGYLTGLEPAYGWGDLTRMSIHTSIGFLFLSLGVISIAWNGSINKVSSIPSWFSGVIFIGGVTATVLLWQAQVEDKRQDIEGKFKLKIEKIKSLLLTELDSQSFALTQMGKRWEVGVSLSEREWKGDATNYLDHNSGYLAIELWDPTYNPKWVILNKSVGANQEMPLFENSPKMRKALEKAKRIKSLTASPIIKLQNNENGFSINVPIFPAGNFNGFVIGILNFDRLMKKILIAGQYSEFHFSLSEGKNKFYQLGKGDDQIQTNWGCETSLSFQGNSWKLQAWPTVEWLHKEKTNISNFLLIQGILMAFLLSLAMHYIRKEKVQKYYITAMNKKNLQEIGARYRAQKSLNESANRFKTLVEKMNDGLATQDANGILTFVNEKFCDMFGFPRGEIIGKPLNHFIEKENEKDNHEQFDLKRLKNIRPYQSIGIKKDKKPIYLIISPEIIIDSEGKNIGSFCVITDITELKSIQKNLTRQKEVLDIILNSVPAMIWFKDKNNNILHANKFAAESIGLSLEEVKGKSTFKLYPEEAEQYHRDDLEVIQSGKPKFGIIEVYRAKNNEKGWIHTDKIPYRDENGEIKGVIVFSLDITERQKAEYELNKYKNHLEEVIRQRQKELVHSEARFKQVILDSPIPIMVHDDQGNVVMISQRWTDLSGYSSNEISTVWDWINKAYEEEKSDEIQRNINKIFESNQLIHEGEFEIITSNGKKRTWDFISKPFTDLKENRKYAISMAVDITDRKVAEQSLINSQKQLLHAEKLNATGKLSASIAHEFNNPIYGIRNVLEKVGDDIPMDVTYTEFINLAIKECNRMAGLIQKLHEFHQPSSGILEILDIHEIIDETVLWAHKRLKENGVTLKKEYTKGISKIEGVSDQIKQVILNLIHNAEEAISNGNGSILIKTEAFSSKIKVRIKDNGVGVNEEILNKIFDPFFTTKPAVKGTGLGLFVSYGIIKSHGGNIEVNSQVGQGTEFIITLPYTQGE